MTFHINSHPSNSQSLLPRVVAIDLGFPRIHSNLTLPTFTGVVLENAPCNLPIFVKDVSPPNGSIGRKHGRTVPVPCFYMIFGLESWKQTEYHGHKSPSPPSSTNWSLSIIAPYFFMAKNQAKAHIPYP